MGSHMKTFSTKTKAEVYGMRFRSDRQWLALRTPHGWVLSRYALRPAYARETLCCDGRWRQRPKAPEAV